MNNFLAKNVKIIRGGKKPAAFQLSLPTNLEFAGPLLDDNNNLCKDNNGNQLFNWKNGKIVFKLEPHEMGELINKIKLLEDLNKSLILKKEKDFLGNITKILWKISNEIVKILSGKELDTKGKTFKSILNIVDKINGIESTEKKLEELKTSFTHKYEEKTTTLIFNPGLNMKKDNLQVSLYISRTVNKQKTTPVLIYVDMNNLEVLKSFLNEGIRLSLLEPYQELKRYFKNKDKIA